MAVAREKGDQAKENGCENCDPGLPVETALPAKTALAVKSDIHRSQHKTGKQTSTPEPPGHPWNHGVAPEAICGSQLAWGSVEQLVHLQLEVAVLGPEPAV